MFHAMLPNTALKQGVESNCCGTFVAQLTKQTNKTSFPFESLPAARTARHNPNTAAALHKASWVTLCHSVTHTTSPLQPDKQCVLTKANTPSATICATTFKVPKLMVKVHKPWHKLGHTEGTLQGQLCPPSCHTALSPPFTVTIKSTFDSKPTVRYADLGLDRR